MLTKNRQTGSAMLVVMVLLSALLLASAVSMRILTQTTRNVDLAQYEKKALYCAEAGLAAASDILVANVSTWSGGCGADPDPVLLDSTTANDPAWYPIRGDIDDPLDGVADFEVTIADNGDEAYPSPNDPNGNCDGIIYVTSRCIKYPEAPRSLRQMAQSQGAGSAYRNQSGHGSGNTGNSNL
jgi:hypothetical protein